ncbi:hypothetical protein MMC06_002178 [Schaereria dolodes]|nr:hypothetical protein [Schaereria dolodes]
MPPLRSTQTSPEYPRGSPNYPDGLGPSNFPSTQDSDGNVIGGLQTYCVNHLHCTCNGQTQGQPLVECGTESPMRLVDQMCLDPAICACEDILHSSGESDTTAEGGSGLSDVDTSDDEGVALVDLMSPRLPIPPINWTPMLNLDISNLRLNDTGSWPSRSR